jgi:endonuclease/exonuclease/phosphatase family metal-dependent hydrolase
MRSLIAMLPAASLMMLSAASATFAIAGDALNVKVMTFNIRYDNPDDGPNRWPLRRDMAVGVIQRFAADFVGFQEPVPGQVADLRKSLPDYRMIGRSRDADPAKGEAVPIFYRDKRWQLDEKQHGVFWLSDTPQTPGSTSWGNTLPRVVTWGRFIDRQSGRALYVYNTHFDHSSETARRKSAALLARRIADREHREPAIVMGDFNAGESSAALAHLIGQASDSPIKLIDTFRAVHPDEKQVGTFHDFRGGNDGEKIDYILTTAGATVRSADILRDHRGDRYPSDHYPATAEIAF